MLVGGWKAGRRWEICKLEVWKELGKQHKMFLPSVKNVPLHRRCYAISSPESFGSYPVASS